MKKYWQYILSLFFILTQGTLFAQNLYSPYPIIFVHGLISDHNAWVEEGTDNDVFDYLEKAGYVNGGRLDVTLDFKRDTASLVNSKEDDVHLFHLNNIKADFYAVNFCVHASGSSPHDIPKLLGYYNGRVSSVLESPVVPASEKIYVTIPMNFIIGDIIRIGNEFMVVKGIGESYIAVDHPKFGSQAMYHNINDDIWNLSAESNQASIAKQGLGLKMAIDEVKSITGAKKVILVGHSMGGLAIREYLRNYYNSDVAKVVTIGTPHLGSNAAEMHKDITDFLGIDVRSDAIRDLSYNYNVLFKFGNPTFDRDMDNGTYLFGGLENEMSKKTNFYSCDVNGNGIIDSDSIKGIYNDPSSLPSKVSYCWIVSQWKDWMDPVYEGDGLVRLERQFPWTKRVNGSPLIEIGDTLMTYLLHTDENKDYNTIIRGLDEPDNNSLAYEIGSSDVIKGYITVQTNSNIQDQDLYRLDIPNSGILSINVAGIIKAGVEKIELLDSSLSVLVISESGDYQADISEYLDAGTYYIRITGKAKSDAYNNPYTIKTSFIESEVELDGVLRLEYFIDTDHGYGKGTLVSITSSSNMVENFDIPLADINDGMHTLFLRVKDERGRWSMTQNVPFFKLTVAVTEISQLEYYTDIDPGFGNAIPVPITSDADLTKNFNIDLSNVTEGFHTLYIRAKDTSGKWSLLSATPFYRLQKGEITELEYYFDNDPGDGFRSIANIEPASSDVEKQFHVDLACLDSENHIFYIIAKDNLNNKSYLYSGIITVSIVAPTITQNGNVLYSNSTSGNQWYNQDGAIVGATDQDYVVRQEGSYYVVVTHSGCSSEKSNTIDIVNTVLTP